MSSVNDQNSGAYKENAAQPLARLILSNPEVELTSKQQEALLKVLKDAPPLWPDQPAPEPAQPEPEPDQPAPTQPEPQQPAPEPIPTPEPEQPMTQQPEVQQPIIIQQVISPPELQIKSQERVQTLTQQLRKRRLLQQQEKKRSTYNKIKTILLFILLAGAGFFGWFLWRTTFAVFEYELQPLIIIEGQHIEPSDFLAPGMKTEGVTAVYRNPVFSPSIGQQDVPLTLSMGWRTVETTATLCVLTAIHNIEHEFADAAPELKAHDLITNIDDATGLPLDIQFTVEPLPLEDYPVGEFILNLTLNGRAFNVTLTVRDTTAPEATSVNKIIPVGEEVRPEDFVKDVRDASDHLPISISYYGEEPDVFGFDQTVSIIIKDHYGNQTIIFSALSIRHNEAPPVIEGARDILINVGDVIRYMQGVTAFDDFGRDLTALVLVDDSGVDPFTVGVYPIRYVVTDFSGNTTEINRSVHVLDIDMDLVNGEVDTLLEDIINDGMTQLQKVRAIFSWVRGNITYAPSNDRIGTAYEGAYRALREGRGNYYVYYSISEVMLTRAGIANMPIDRIEGSPVRHRWNLVDPDNLGWHHFDSYPVPLGLGIQMAFFTESQAVDFTQQIANLAGSNINDYYTYDPVLYPSVVP